MNSPDRRRNVAITALVAMVILAFITFRSEKTPSQPPPQVQSSENAAETQDPMKIDTDGDGLTDWEEIINGTDPHNPDSNGNGIPDGQEGTDAHIENSVTQPSFSSGKSTTDNQTASGNQNKIESDTSGRTSGTATQQSGQTSAAQTDPYHIYANNLAQLLKAISKNSSVEGQVWVKLGSNPDSSAFDDLTKYAQKYKDLSTIIAKLTVPDDMKSLNSTLAASYSAIGAAFDELASHKSAGSIPTSSYTSYTNTVSQNAQAVYAIAVYFRDHSIHFSVTEDASVFILP